MGKIGDLIVRLQLKYQDYEKGLKKAEKDTKGFASGLNKGIGMVKAAWAAAGAAVIAFGKQMIQATNVVGDEWARMTASMGARWQSVLADITNYKPDFSSLKNFLKNEWKWIKGTIFNAKEAGDAAREMADAFDAEFELTNSLKIQRAKISGELADLQVEMRNTALSPEARMAAVERYKALLEPLYEAEIATRKNMLDAAVKTWLAGSGVTATTEQVADFFANIGTNPAMAAAQHPELARIYNTRKGDKANQPIFDAIYNLTQAENGLQVELKMVNRTANSLAASLVSVSNDLAAMQTELKEMSETAAYELADELLQDIDLTDIKIEPMDWDAILGDYDSELDEFLQKWRDTQMEIEMLNGMIEGAIVSSMSNGLQAITDMMVGLEGADATQVLSALLQPFADTAIQLGEMLLAQGIAVTAFKESLDSLQGAPAIAAGLALIAIGSAMRSGIQALARGGSGASTTSYNSGASEAANTETYKSELTVYVEGKISGKDIVLSGNKTLNSWRR